MTWTTQPRFDGPGGMAYVRAGSGPALVMIHGVGLRAESWAAVMPYLTPHFSIYAVDMPGHGQSKLEGAKVLEDYQRRVSEFCKPLVGPIYLAGHSMGAMIALRVASRRPQTVAGVAALNAIYRRAPKAAKAVRARADALGGAAIADPGATLARWFGPAPEGDLKQAADACRDWLTDADPTGYASAYRVFAGQDGPADSDLSDLEMPALFMTGRDDPNSTPAMSQAMAARAPKGQAQVIDAAHMMPMTHPDAVAKAMIAVFTS